MNFRGELGGNWTWRFIWDQVHEQLAQTYKDMTIMYERPPIKKDSDDTKIEIEEE